MKTIDYKNVVKELQEYLQEWLDRLDGQDYNFPNVEAYILKYELVSSMLFTLNDLVLKNIHTEEDENKD